MLHVERIHVTCRTDTCGHVTGSVLHITCRTDICICCISRQCRRRLSVDHSLPTVPNLTAPEFHTRIQNLPEFIINLVTYLYDQTPNAIIM